MDATGFFIMDKLRKNEPLDMKEIFMMVVIIPFIGKLFNSNGYFMIFIDYISKLIFEQGQKKLKSKYAVMTISGNISQNITAVLHKSVDCKISPIFLAINRYVLEQNLAESFDSINLSESGDNFSTAATTTSKCEIIAKEIKEFTKLCIYDNQKIDVKIENITEFNDKSNYGPSKNTTYTFTLRMSKSANSSIIFDKFINQKLDAYKLYLESKTKDKYYHFVFLDTKNDLPVFSSSIINDKNHTLNNETFDTLFHDHVDRLKTDIVKLRDKEYYMTHGLRRKKGYLFYGEPGTGKTSSVMAIANADNRHIMEISIQKIKNINTLRQILNLTSINNISFNKSEIVYLFDEINFENNNLFDMKQLLGSRKQYTSDTETETSKPKSDTKPIDTCEQIDINEVLSLFDGIGNYDGAIIVATTNHKEKLNPAICREMRLTPLYFTYMDKTNLIKMIKKVYRIKTLSSKKLAKIPDPSPLKWSAAKVRTLMELHENSLDNFLAEMKV